jgi:hypothetical protein
MPDPTSDKIGQTQDSFPANPPGAVAECPFKKAAAEADAAAAAKAAQTPVEVKKSFDITQQVLNTLGYRQTPQQQKQKKDWIEIILVDMEGKPMPGVKYRITPPGGAPVEGRLNEHGQAGLYQIEPGNCKVTFPDLDKEAWE